MTAQFQPKGLQFSSKRHAAENDMGTSGMPDQSTWEMMPSSVAVSE